MMKKIILAICLIGAVLITPMMTQAGPIYQGGYDAQYSSAVSEAWSSLTKKENVFKNTLNDYMNNGGCWYCSAYEQLFTAINKLATKLFVGLSQTFIVLLGLGLLFMILFKVGKMLAQLKEVDLVVFMNDLVKPLGKAMFASSLLAATSWGGDNIFNILITPFLEIGFAFSSQIITIVINGNI